MPRQTWRKKGLSPEEALRLLEAQVRSVKGLPIRKAERALGVKGYAKGGASSYLSPQLYKQVKRLGG